MIADVAGVRSQPKFAIGLVGAVAGVQQRFQRRFHVNDDFAIVGKVHDAVRAHAFRRHDFLIEGDMLDHAGILDATLQLLLAPVAAHLRATQRFHELARAGAETIADFGNALYRSQDRLIRPFAFNFEILSCGPELFERLSHRL